MKKNDHIDHDECSNEEITQRIIKAIEETHCGQPMFEALLVFNNDIVKEIKNMCVMILNHRENH